MSATDLTASESLDFDVGFGAVWDKAVAKKKEHTFEGLTVSEANMDELKGMSRCDKHMCWGVCVRCHLDKAERESLPGIPASSEAGVSDLVRPAIMSYCAEHEQMGECPFCSERK